MNKDEIEQAIHERAKDRNGGKEPDGLHLAYEVELTRLRSQLAHVTDDEMRWLLGEGFHTAFRKAIDHPDAMTIHRQIQQLPPGEWTELIRWVVWALKESGVRFHWKP